MIFGYPQRTSPKSFLLEVQLAIVALALPANLATLPQLRAGEVLADDSWNNQFAARLDAVEALVVQRILLREQLKREGLESDMDGDEFLEWLASATQEEKQRHTEVTELEGQIRRQLKALWLEVGEPVNLPSISINRLVDDASQITEAYRHFLKDHGKDSRQDVVRAALPRIVDALDTDYAWLAMLVFQECVQFDSQVIVDHIDVTPEPTRATRLKLYRTMKRWLDRMSCRLVWDQEANKFIITKGSRKLPIEWHQLDWGPG